MLAPKVEPVIGYRVLSDDEIALINACKSNANRLSELLEEIRLSGQADPKWLGEAELTLQKGFMYLVRSIAKPSSF
jgi:hypothetical protein